MSSVLGTLFTRRSAALKSHGHDIPKHIAEHEVIGKHLGHSHHEDGRSETRNEDTPSFLLHLWSALPILLVALGSYKIAIIAAIINFFLIQTWTSTSNRYIMSGFVSFIALLAHLLTS